MILDTAVWSAFNRKLETNPSLLLPLVLFLKLRIIKYKESQFMPDINKDQPAAGVHACA